MSMHPKWQEKILKYYCDLFMSGGAQTAQMIFATHSEYVLRAALTPPNNNDMLIIYFVFANQFRRYDIDLKQLVFRLIMKT